MALRIRHLTHAWGSTQLSACCRTESSPPKAGVGCITLTNMLGGIGVRVGESEYVVVVVVIILAIGVYFY